MTKITGKAMFEGRSEVVQDLLNRPPLWVVRWGITVIVVLMLISLIGASQISYNEIVQARVVVTTLNPPVQIESKINGRILDVLVSADQKVNEGDILAVLDNGSRLQDVMRLKDRLTRFNPSDYKSMGEFLNSFPDNILLGALQEDYGSFVSDFQTFFFYENLKPNEREMSALSAQINEGIVLHRIQEGQVKLFKEELGLSEKNFLRSAKLCEGGAISDLDLEIVTRSFLADKGKLENLKINSAATLTNITNLKRELVKLEIIDSEKKRVLYQKLYGSLQKLKHSIFVWEQQYVIKSPTSGILTLFDVWAKNQNVKSGQVLFTVVQPNPGKLIGVVTLPVSNSGVVEIGQEVRIKLDNYPYTEWGSLKGHIESIAATPKNDKPQYTIYVKIESLNTSFNKLLKLRQEMHGNVEIITKKITVLERILYQFRKVTSR